MPRRDQDLNATALAMGYTTEATTRRRSAAGDPSQNCAFEKSTACRRRGQFFTAARACIAEENAPAERTFDDVRSKFGQKNAAVVALEAHAAAKLSRSALVSVGEVALRLDNEYDP